MIVIKNIKDFITSKMKNKGVLLGTVGVLAATILGSVGISRCNKNSKNVSNETNPSVTSTLEETTSTNDTIRVEGSTNGTSAYSVETIKDNYVSPTRNTNENSNSNSNENYYDETVETLRPTTNPDTVVTTTTGTTTSSTTNNTTGTSEPKETGKDGKVINGTEPEIKPTGTETLPIEPTKETIVPSNETYETTGTTIEVPIETVNPNEPSNVIESTTIEVPVVTVDPNDPNNVYEYAKPAKKNSKGLKLVLGGK